MCGLTAAHLRKLIDIIRCLAPVSAQVIKSGLRPDCPVSGADRRTEELGLFVRESVKTIWRDVLEGNSNAWSKLVRLYTPLVLSVARRGGLRQADAEDCAQLTWVTLYKNRYDIRQPEKIPGWLTRVTARKVIHFARERVRDMQLAPQSQADNLRGLPDEDLLDVERDAQLEMGLQQLDPQCRRVLVAFFYGPGDKTYRDVSRELNIAPNSLGPTRMRCLRKLKRILTKTGYPWIPLK